MLLSPQWRNQISTSKAINPFAVYWHIYLPQVQNKFLFHIKNSSPIPTQRSYLQYLQDSQTFTLTITLGPNRKHPVAIYLQQIYNHSSPTSIKVRNPLALMILWISYGSSLFLFFLRYLQNTHHLHNLSLSIVCPTIIPPSHPFYINLFVPSFLY